MQKPEILSPNTSSHYNALQELNLKTKWLTEITSRALLGYHTATKHDAVNAAGTYAYFAAIKAVRDILVPQGWEIHREHNLEMTRYCQTGTILIISSGNELTGIHGKKNPKTRNHKGTQTQKAVDRNHEQLYLWPELQERPITSKINKDLGSSWILLYYVDSKNSEMRSELSLPISIDPKELRVDNWQTRIILPPVKFDHEPINPDQEREYAPDMDITIKRRINE